MSLGQCAPRASRASSPAKSRQPQLSAKIHRILPRILTIARAARSAAGLPMELNLKRCLGSVH